MANFAKAQLEKYGWSEGKGLGKNEDGITTAIKPKLKFDTAGIGHKDVDNFWWDAAYNKALQNISVDKKSEDVTIKVLNKSAVDISTTKPRTKKKNDIFAACYDKFLKTSTLQGGTEISRTEIGLNKPAQDINEIIPRLTDDELLKACGGRTAHKGARHGLNLNGKLARIAQQEKDMLAAAVDNCATDCWVVKEDLAKRKRKRPLADCEPPRSTEFTFCHNPILKRSKDSRRKEKRRINDLTHQLTKSCTIEDSSSESAQNKSSSTKKVRHHFNTSDDIPDSKKDYKKEKKSKKERKRLCDDRKDDNANDIRLLESIPYRLLCRRLSSDCFVDKMRKSEQGHSSKEKYMTLAFMTAKKLNAKLNRKKAKSYVKKQEKKVQQLSESLLAVHLDTNVKTDKEDSS